MSGTLQTFDGMVDAMCASLQASYGALIDVSSGSLARALMQSSASLATWLQFLNLQVLATTRLATSTGTDVDSWVADFGLTRLPATAATGQVVMTSLSPVGSSAVVPNGAAVRAADGSVSFIVVGGPYNRPPGTASVSVNVVATTPGVVGNVGAGEITLLGSAIPGIDTVTNTAAFANGADGESDAALRARFIAYINSRAQATVLAIVTAVQSVQLGMSCTVIENQAADTTPAPGHFTVVVDDGSGQPPVSVLALASSAIDAVRPIGSTFTVVPPTLVIADVQLVITADPQSVFATVTASITSAVTLFIDGLPVGAVLPLSRVSALAYAASPSVDNVIGVMLNGGTSDLGGGVSIVVRAGTISVVAG